uniref:THIF-type NAD/FAD binding fold domain-containing protein n=1 Tax=Globisporangium ultimum (strain ATCC 200006 / CBS 805.95 / DAOM BR144) TaxID=431595 RepID=K3WUA2_GLOUD
MDAPVRPHKHEFTAATEPSANPYSHIVANNDRGVLHSIERLQEHGVAVIGLNGIGSLTAEAFTRYGVKSLVVIDNTEITLSDLSLMQFQAQDVSKRKDEAMASMLRKLNPDITVRAAAISLQQPHDVLHTLRAIYRRTQDEKNGRSGNEDDSDGKAEDSGESDESEASETDGEAPNDEGEGGGVETQEEPAAPLSSTAAAPLPAINHRNRCLSVVFLCVQHAELANALNEFCCEFGIVFVYVFVGRNGITGELLSVIPGRSSCLQCLNKRKIFKANGTTNDLSDNIEGTSRTRDGAAGAYQPPHQPRHLGPCLPSTECILAGLAMQNALMELLSFGSFCSRVEYDGILDELDRSGFLPPVHLCPNPHCRQQQQRTYASSKS